jgi:ABC-type glycerol-3-phosphate transport system substrate-binding protein
MVGSRCWTRRAALAGPGGGAALAALAAGGCGTPAAPAGRPAGDQPVTLTWAVRGGGTPEARQGLLDEYRQARPQVTVEQVDASGGIAPSIEKIAAAMAAGVPVDVINGHLAARQLIESIDAVQPIDDLVKRDKLDLGRYNQGALEATGRYEGKLYTLTYAYGGDVAAVAFNKGLFAQAGVREPSADWGKPWAWDEFRAAMRRLTNTQGGAITQVGMTSFGYWVHSAILQWGARWLSTDYKTVVCDSQQTLDAFARFEELLFKDRVISDSPGADLGSGNAFLAGKAAVTMPCCAALTFARSTRGSNVEWGLTTMPRGTVSSLDVSPVIMGLAKTSAHRDAAWDFLRFLDEGSRLAAVEERMPGVLPDMLPWIRQNFAEWPQANAEMLAEGMKVAKPLEPLRYHPQWQKMAQEVLDPTWKDVLGQTRGLLDAVRAAKPLLQNIVDEHARARAAKR